MGSKKIHLKGNYHTTYLTDSLELKPREPGWHIFEVLVNGTVKAQMPLNVIIQPNLGEKKIISLHPRRLLESVQTFFSNPKCYARELENCESKLSREHFMSKNILEELNLRGGLVSVGFRLKKGARS